MDLVSTGSVISKQKIDTAFIQKELKVIADADAVIKTEEDSNVVEMTIDDFIDDFKL